MLCYPRMLVSLVFLNVKAVTRTSGGQEQTRAPNHITGSYMKPAQIFILSWNLGPNLRFSVGETNKQGRRQTPEDPTETLTRP